MPWIVAREYVEEAATKLAVEFPASYVALMMARNGGVLDLDGEQWDVCPIWDRTDRSRLKRTFNDVVRETTTAREMAWFPPAGVVIGICNADRLVLLPEEDGSRTLSEEVYVWRFDGDGVESSGKTVGELLDRV